LSFIKNTRGKIGATKLKYGLVAPVALVQKPPEN